MDDLQFTHFGSSAWVFCARSALAVAPVLLPVLLHRCVPPHRSESVSHQIWGGPGASVELLRPPALWLAYESYLRAADGWWSAWSSMQTEDLYRTRRLLERSIAADPSYARSYAMLANTYTNAWVIPWDDDYLKPQTLDRALDLARKAILLDPNLPQAHSQFGAVLNWRGERQASNDSFERAISLNPSHSDRRFSCVLVFAWRVQTRDLRGDAHMRPDPFYPGLLAGWKGWAFYFLKEYDQALPLLRECVLQTPKLDGSHAHG